MVKKLLLFAFAFVLLICTNLAVSYRVSVDGQALPDSFTGTQLRRCAVVSAKAADEISRADTAPAKYSVVPVYSLRGADGDCRALNDALISSRSGIARYCQVYEGDTLCGTVSDPETVINAMAVGDVRYSFKPVYSFTGRPSDNVIVG